MSLIAVTSSVEWSKALSELYHDWYHTWDCHQIANVNNEGEPLLLLYKHKDVQIGFPILLRDVDGTCKDITSVYGYAGIISNKPADKMSIDGFFQALEYWCLERIIVSAFSRMHPLLSPVDHLFPKNIIHRLGKTVSIDLTLSLEDQFRAYNSNIRRGVKKLRAAGAYCKADNSYIDIFMDIYRQTMKRVSASDYYFFDKDYYHALLTSPSFDSKVYCVYDVEDEIMASGIFIFTGDIVQYHLGGTYNDYLRLAPSKLMFDQVRIDATEMGYKHFHLGGGVGSQQDSLFKFKAGFSKQVYDFQVMKWIVDGEQYNKLIEKHKQRYPEKHMNSDYFPFYRQ